MTKFRFLIRISLRFFAAMVGLALLGYLVFRTGPGVVLKQLQAVGWGLALIIILGGFSQLVKTCAWRQTFRCDIRGLSWSRSFGRNWPLMRSGNLVLLGSCLGTGFAYLCWVLQCRWPVEYRPARLTGDCIP